MMSQGILEELQFFGSALLRGALLLVVYDLLRIFRRVAPHGKVWIALEDLFYWILTAFLVFALLYRENDGAVRGYALLAVGLGMLLYHQLISSWAVFWLSRILNGCLSVLLKPVKIIWKKLVQVLRMVSKFYKKKLKKQLKEFIMILFS